VGSCRVADFVDKSADRLQVTIFVSGCDGLSPLEQPAEDDAVTLLLRVREARTHTISVTTHPTDLLFISPSGQTFQFPIGPLAPGTQVLASDTLTQHGTGVGNDSEHCTITFSVNALCDDTAVFVGGDQLRVSYTFQWPSTGPLTSLNGEIIGGTGSYYGARGHFYQAANPDGSFQLTGSYTTTS
jgi:hypothetical protein